MKRKEERAISSSSKYVSLRNVIKAKPRRPRTPPRLTPLQASLHTSEKKLVARSKNMKATKSSRGRGSSRSRSRSRSPILKKIDEHTQTSRRSGLRPSARQVNTDKKKGRLNVNPSIHLRSSAVSLLRSFWKVYQPYLNQVNVANWERIVDTFASFMIARMKLNYRVKAPRDAWIVWQSHMLRSHGYVTTCSKWFGEIVPHTVEADVLHDMKECGQVEQQWEDFKQTESYASIQTNPRLKRLYDTIRKDIFHRVNLAAVTKDLGFFPWLLRCLGHHKLGPLCDYRCIEWIYSDLPAQAIENAQNLLHSLMTVLGGLYKDYLTICARPAVISPTPPIDWLWHTHMLHPVEYEFDNKAAFGKVVHHSPGGEPIGHEETWQEAIGYTPETKIAYFCSVHQDDLTSLEQSWQWSDPPKVTVEILDAYGFEDIEGKNMVLETANTLTQAMERLSLWEAVVKPTRLLVLDMNGVLLHRNRSTGEITLNPHLKTFLWSVHGRFALGFWTANIAESAQREVDLIMQHAPAKFKPLFVWSQNDCEIPDNKYSEEIEGKPLFLKPIEKIFESFPIYGIEETVMIEHSAEKIRNNPPHNCFIVSQYTGEDTKVNPLDPNGRLMPLIERLAIANDMPTIIRTSMRPTTSVRRQRQEQKKIDTSHLTHKPQFRDAADRRDFQRFICNDTTEGLFQLFLASMSGHPNLKHLTRQHIYSMIPLVKDRIKACDRIHTCSRFTVNRNRSDDKPDCGRHLEKCSFCSKPTRGFKLMGHTKFNYCGCKCETCDHRVEFKVNRLLCHCSKKCVNCRKPTRHRRHKPNVAGLTWWCGCGCSSCGNNPCTCPKTTFSCRCCSCYTDDCIVQVLVPHQQMQRTDDPHDIDVQTWPCVSSIQGHVYAKRYQHLQEGELVFTGQFEVTNEPIFKRVTRIVKVPTFRNCEVVRVSDGCYLTSGHPISTMNGVPGKGWHKPEELVPEGLTIRYEKYVYTMELDGHIDTIDLGGVIATTLGIYCGPQFGWNLFTRKTRRCVGDPNCSICDELVIPSLDFTSVSADDFAVQYHPVNYEPK